MGCGSDLGCAVSSSIVLCSCYDFHVVFTFYDNRSTFQPCHLLETSTVDGLSIITSSHSRVPTLNLYKRPSPAPDP